jgi:uroporphyrinogen decarboxylase
MPLIETDFLGLTQNLDVRAFWEENGKCGAFSTAKPRAPASFSPDDHWLFEFMGIPSTVRYYDDKPYRDALHREVNQLTQQYVGRSFFEEYSWQSSPNRIEYLFGCKRSILEGGTPWLTPATDDPAALAKIIDRAETTDLRTWTFPEPFLAEWQQRQREGKTLPRLGEGSRGPATIITSVLAPENALLWMLDHPELMRRFRDVLAAKMVELNHVLREFSGNTQPGWWITDDNCALLSPRLYKEFCYPVLEQVLAAMAPGSARRYQHSDSAMGHLLDLQYALGIRAVNYGPEVDAALIRRKMPDAVIYGQMPPFLLRNGTAAEIRQRVIDDFCKAGETGGIELTTAGSLAAGTGLGRMRWFMQLVQEHCRYDQTIGGQTSTVSGR